MWRDPFEEIRRLERRMNRLFGSMWGERGRALPSRGTRWMEPFREGAARDPFADVVETENEIKVAAELPGVRKEDIKIDATSNKLEISAEARKEEEAEEEGYLSRERGYSRYYRAFTLPSEVDSNKAKATYKNGVLEVTLPKKEAEKRSHIKVE